MKYLINKEKKIVEIFNDYDELVLTKPVCQIIMFCEELIKEANLK